MSRSLMEADLVRLPSGVNWYGSAPQDYLEVLRRAVALYGDDPALIASGGVTVTYSELWNRATSIAGGLRDAGLGDGDRVCLKLPDGITWVETFLGTLLAGGVPVPLDSRATAAAQDVVIADAAPFAVVDAEHPLTLGLPFVAEVSPESLGLLLYTSGTTGKPKGVMISHRTLASYGELTRRMFALEGDSCRLRSLVTIPLCHSAGCNGQLLPTLALGGVAILVGSAKVGAILDMAERHQPDTIMSVPAVYQLMVMREPRRLAALSSLRRVVYGAAATPVALIQRLNDLLPEAELGNAFGMTEISNVATYRKYDPSDTRRGGIGVPVAGVEVEVRGVDASGNGELFLRGPNMAMGYWRRPEATEATFGSGWVRSGDIATIEADGQIFLHARVNDVINRGGEKIFPTEIENVLLSWPDVAEASVFAVPDLVMGHKVGAVVVPADGVDPANIDIASRLVGQIPAYAIPEYAQVRSASLPRGTSGKVLVRNLLNELGWQG